MRTATPPDLSAIDNVAAGYVHRDKLIEPGEGLALKSAWLKWYDIALPEMPVPPEIRNLARAAVAREAAGAKMDLTGELGFVIGPGNALGKLIHGLAKAIDDGTTLIGDTATLQRLAFGFGFGCFDFQDLVRFAAFLGSFAQAFRRIDLVH